MSSPCCDPAFGRAEPHRRTVPVLVRVGGGSCRMGAENPDINPQDGEGAVGEVQLSPFWMSWHTVTNTEFAKFVREIEPPPGAKRFGWSYVFASSLPAHLRRGSYLCDAWYCNRYLIAARTNADPSSCTGNIGFRCTMDA